MTFNYDLQAPLLSDFTIRAKVRLFFQTRRQRLGGSLSSLITVSGLLAASGLQWLDRQELSS
jgi:hypothetical protein